MKGKLNHWVCRKKLVMKNCDSTSIQVSFVESTCWSIMLMFPSLFT